MTSNAINKPLISIIVPCYNQGQYLEECLQSVLFQTYPNWECIVVNDGSPDDTEEIVAGWLKDSRFKYIRKENGGLSSARNTGIEIAKGDWLQFLDCDDLLEPDKLSASAQYFDKNVDIILSGYRYFEHKEGSSKKRILGRDGFLPEVFLNAADDVDLKQLFKKKNPFVISAPLYGKRIFEKNKGFDERLKSLEDWEFNLRCALSNFKFQHIGYPLGSKTLIRLHDTSMMRDRLKMALNFRKFAEICNENAEFVKEFGAITLSDRSPRSIKSALKEIVKLFVPPIFPLIIRKIFDKRAAS